MNRYELPTTTSQYDVTMHTYSGRTVRLACGVEEGEARDVLQCLLRQARREGKTVERIGRGEWEVRAQGNAVRVSDNEGTTYLQLVRRGR